MGYFLYSILDLLFMSYFIIFFLKKIILYSLICFGNFDFLINFLEIKYLN